MINRFKIWFNRNNYKIMMTVLAIVVFYAAIKGLNRYFKNFKDDSNTNSTAKSNIYSELDGEVLFENKEDINTYKKIDETEDEYAVLQNIIKIMFNKIAQANQNNNDMKSELYDMCLDSFIDEMTSYQKEPTTDNILDYYPGVTSNNIDKYSFEELYKYYTNKDINGYIVNMKYDLEDDNYESNLIVIYVDYKNKTFAYGGSYARLDGVNCLVDVENINAIGGNTF